MPVDFDPEDDFAAALARPGLTPPGDFDEEHIPGTVIDYCISRYGGVEAAVAEAACAFPSLFAAMFERVGEYGIGADDLAEFAGTAWCAGADRCLDRVCWRELFELAGYRENDEPAERPSATLMLWRGSTPEHRTNWSWTPNRDTAMHFASGWAVQTELGLVWRTIVEPERLLAKIDRGPRYTEYVLDTEGLVVEPDGLWCRCPVDLDPYGVDDRSSQLALDLHELVTCTRR